MCKPWDKMTKDEKVACGEHKIIKGLGIALFGLIWSYFATLSVDVWSALPLTIAIWGVLLLLYGLVKKFS